MCYNAFALYRSAKHMMGNGVEAWCRTRRRLAEKEGPGTGDRQFMIREAHFRVAIASSGEPPLTVVGFDLSRMFQDGTVSLGILQVI